MTHEIWSHTSRRGCPDGGCALIATAFTGTSPPDGEQALATFDPVDGRLRFGSE
ncbi:MAG: hypothetical protein R6U01_02205 [Halorubrum sp.]|uniref:hypothetical protein n=1 Tax=Halorubrum sp. TaxID=1879286 RepID=UPI003970E966